MKRSEETSGKDASAGKSMNELMSLLMKLNDKLRGKISSRRKTQDARAEKTDVIIIMMTSEEEEAPAARTIKARPAAAEGDWMQSLFKEIEQGACSKK